MRLYLSEILLILKCNQKKYPNATTNFFYVGNNLAFLNVKLCMEMETTEEKNIVQHNITFNPSEHDKYLKEAMQLIKNTISRSIDSLDKYHILDSVCQKMSKIIENPVGAMLDSIAENEQRISGMLNFIVQSELEANENIVASAYKFEKTDFNVLMYCIVFKSEDEKNRYKLNKFLLDYEQSDFHPRFKIIFQYIPQNMEADLLNITKIFPQVNDTNGVS